MGSTKADPMELSWGSSLSPPALAQEAALHPELHPHELVPILHATSRVCVHQGLDPLRPAGQQPLLSLHREGTHLIPCPATAQLLPILPACTPPTFPSLLGTCHSLPFLPSSPLLSYTPFC